MKSPDIAPNNRILIIDDNRAIHDDFRKIFGFLGGKDRNLDITEAELFGEIAQPDVRPAFELDSAFQGQEGLDLVRKAQQEGRPYAMAFVDVRMPPGWNGVETIAHIWQEHPDLQIVVCTAYSDYSLDEIRQKLGHSDRLVILKKPFDNIEALQLAHALTEKWRLVQEARANTDDLEQRVAARTGELQDANQRLKTEMEGRARLEEAFRQAQKMEAVGQLAGGIAHDFNNILTVIRGYLSLVLDDQDLAQKTREPLEQVDAAAQRAANLTRQLLTFSRKQMVKLENLNLNEVIAQVTKMLYRVLGEHVSLTVETSHETPGVHADRAMMEQVLLNLVLNARDAMPDGGQLSIQTSLVEFGGNNTLSSSDEHTGRFVCVTVTDNGCGIAPEIRDRIFEPFFTTKAAGKGTGLGLATVYGVVKHHNGWVEVASAPDKGSIFKIFLPHSDAVIDLDDGGDEKVKVSRGTETIFLVEDEPALRGVAQKVLQSYGYKVIAACSGLEALKVWPEHSGEIDLLLTDMVMPDGVSGWELAHRLRESRSGLKVIYSSGYSTELEGREAHLKDGLNFLPKPYNPEKLARVVRECLDNDLPRMAISS